MIISNVNRFVSHYDTMGKNYASYTVAAEIDLGLLHFFAEEARNNVFSSLVGRAEMIAYSPAWLMIRRGLYTLTQSII